MSGGFDPDPRHARYPFLAGAREAVERAAVDVAGVIDSEPAVVERARERVERAVADGTVGDPHRSPRVELLSYPVARVLVSMVDQPALRERYADAEAATAIERFWADREVADRATVDRRPLELETLLAELGLADDVTRRPSDAPEPWNERRDAFDVHVARYLRLAADRRDPDWRLTARRLHDGTVPVDGGEFEVLLEAAIADHVAEGLPLSVPDAVTEPLRPAAAAVRESLADLDVDVTIDTVVPGLFPPCVRALLARAGDGGRDASDGAGDGAALPAHSRFALSSFLLAVGLTPAESVDLAGLEGERAAAVERQAERLGGEEPPQYAPPSCATMQAYGDCVNMDERCETIAHPLEYYEDALDDAGEVADWREVRAGADG
ncbi:MAG: DNA primase regulatory subunit PriL [Halobacteriaceae archaeon]